MLIGVVALIVIGPERLPRVARTVGHLAGRLQRYVTDVKADINREMELDELRKMRDSMQKTASDFESSANAELSGVEADLNRSVSDVAADGGDATPATDETHGVEQGANPVETAAASAVALTEPAEANPAPGSR